MVGSEYCSFVFVLCNVLFIGLITAASHGRIYELPRQHRFPTYVSAYIYMFWLSTIFFKFPRNNMLFVFIYILILNYVLPVIMAYNNNLHCDTIGQLFERCRDYYII